MSNKAWTISVFVLAATAISYLAHRLEKSTSLYSPPRHSWASLFSWKLFSRHLYDAYCALVGKINTSRDGYPLSNSYIAAATALLATSSTSSSSSFFPPFAAAFATSRSPFLSQSSASSLKSHNSRQSLRSSQKSSFVSPHPTRPSLRRSLIGVSPQLVLDTQLPHAHQHQQQTSRLDLNDESQHQQQQHHSQHHQQQQPTLNKYPRHPEPQSPLLLVSASSHHGNANLPYAHQDSNNDDFVYGLSSLYSSSNRPPYPSQHTAPMAPPAGPYDIVFDPNAVSNSNAPQQTFYSQQQQHPASLSVSATPQQVANALLQQQSLYETHQHQQLASRVLSHHHHHQQPDFYNHQSMPTLSASVSQHSSYQQQQPQQQPHGLSSYPSATASVQSALSSTHGGPTTASKSFFPTTSSRDRLPPSQRFQLGPDNSSALLDRQLSSLGAAPALSQSQQQQQQQRQPYYGNRANMGGQTPMSSASRLPGEETASQYTPSMSSSYHSTYRYGNHQTASPDKASTQYRQYPQPQPQQQQPRLFGLSNHNPGTPASGALVGMQGNNNSLSFPQQFDLNASAAANQNNTHNNTTITRLDRSNSVASMQLLPSQQQPSTQQSKISPSQFSTSNGSNNTTTLHQMDQLRGPQTSLSTATTNPPTIFGGINSARSNTQPIAHSISPVSATIASSAATQQQGLSSGSLTSHTLSGGNMNAQSYQFGNQNVTVGVRTPLQNVLSTPQSSFSGFTLNSHQTQQPQQQQQPQQHQQPQYGMNNNTTTTQNSSLSLFTPQSHAKRPLTAAERLQNIDTKQRINMSLLELD